MKMRFRDEHGYALFLTVLIITLFGILAMSLIAIVVSGAKKNAIREDLTQAGELAEKGMEHLTNKMQTELETSIGTEGIARSDYIAAINAILSQYSCTKEDGPLISDQNMTGKYEVCVEHVQNAIDESGNENELRKLVTIKSTGIVDGKTKTYTYEMEMGTLEVPDSLKYTLSTVKPERNPLPSDGNIYLHGGVEVYGDIKVGQHLFTFDHGVGLPIVNEDKPAEAHWRRTTLPLLLPSENKTKANIVLGGNVYTFKSNLNEFTEATYGQNKTLISSRAFYEDHLEWKDASVYVQRNIQDAFANKTNPPLMVESDWQSVNLDIDGKMLDADKNIIPNVTNQSSEISGLNTKQSILFTNGGNVTFKNNNRFESGRIENGKTTTFLAGNYHFHAMYVNGNIVIGNKTNSQNPAHYENITMDGYADDRGAILFVNGNVTIQGANLTSNLMIYTNGNVTIENATIDGKKISVDREGSLIVFAKGKVKIADVSLYQDHYSELKGYFYSEQDLVMFGIGSKIKIHGGIAAKRITLNAIRGDYGLKENGEKGASWTYAVNPTQLTSPSRLIVTYDTDLIENFLQFYPPDPKIKHVDPPKLISRHK